MKLDLLQYATSKMILKKIAKDKQFRSWIIKNKEDHLPSEDDVRGNIFIKKLGSTNIKYPRNNNFFLNVHIY